MTLCPGDHLIIKRNGVIMTEEPYSEYVVMEAIYCPQPDNRFQVEVKLKHVELL
jgi:hypothetical protein